MVDSKQIGVRRAQKESLYYKEISKLFLQVTLEDKNLSGLHVNKVVLSPDKSVCNVLFYSEDGHDHFKQRLQDLILYKPSLRKALSQAIKSRYTPELKFKYDTQFEKQQKIEKLFDRLKVENKL